MLKITVFTGEAADEKEEFTADYVSFFSDESYGPPALVAPKDGRPPTARPGQSVVFVNTKYVPLLKIDRLEDEQ